MPTPSSAQMEALERVLSSRRGLKQILDDIRNDDLDPPVNVDSNEWLQYESPLVIDIMEEAVRAVLNAPGERF